MVYTGLRDRLFSAPGEWSVRRCRQVDCGLLWLDPMPVMEDIGKAYLEYFTHGAGDRPRSGLQRWLEGGVAGYLHHRYGYPLGNTGMARYLWWLIYALPGRKVNADFSVFWQHSKPNGRLLEIGCGSGAMLAKLQRLGWLVQGIDLDPSAVKVARARGLKVDHGQLAEQNYQPGSFDVVVMSHVIEHVYDPRTLLSDIRELLVEGGVLVMLTPNSQSLWHRCFGAAWMSLDPPRHLHVFNVATMRRLLQEAGYPTFEVTSIVRGADGTFSGSLDIYRGRRHDMSSIPPLASRLMGRWMQGIEWMLLGLQPHLGEDLLVIARR
jgi:2-polyprenyl-3-methyl-5-hydroxy-6-metoxy-1,4-benzoquinol methylase